MTQRTPSPGSFTLTIDSSLFTIGFAAGIVLGKLVLKNSLLAVAFAMGLGLAVGMSPRLPESV